tara:strand:+ start:123 stop:1880 length:1758 start_codon:yes stop_codon:yes gene_type:complete
MKIFLFFLLIVSNVSFSIDINNIDRSKAVWTDFKVQLNHQVALMVGFSRIDNYLCLFRDTDYKNNSNLKDPDNSSTIGYKAILDEVKCGTGKQNSPWVVKSEQATSSSNLAIEIFNPKETRDTRAKIIVQEEATSSNPYGKIQLDYLFTTKPDADPLYVGYFNSMLGFGRARGMQLSDMSSHEFFKPHEDLYSTTVQFETAVLVDSVIIDPSYYMLGQGQEFYGSLITHIPNVGGIGEVHAYYWDSLFPIPNPNGSSYGNFPDGTPTMIKEVRFTYDNDFVLYIETNTIDMSNWRPNGGMRCLKRDESWNYVPSWFGYGIYDSNGDRLVGNNLGITVDYSGPIQTSSETFNGQITINSGSSITVGWACKKVKDGTHYNNNDICPNTSEGQTSVNQFINGENYENFPLFDIPDGQVLIDSSGNEYYVRHLRPRIVFAEYELSNCDSLDLPTSGVYPRTPDHTYFPYPELTMPNSGAILVNKLANKPLEDSYANGKFHNKDTDSDSDGVLDLLDAYPEDPTKSDNEGLYSTLNHFQPITDGPLPKKFCKLLFNIPGKQPKEYSTDWLNANECSSEQPAVAPIPDPSD